MTGFYASLIRLKKNNPALWNGDFGGRMIKIRTNKDKKIFAFHREKEGNRIVVMLNLTKKPVTFKPVLNGIEGDYTEYFTDQKSGLNKSVRLTLKPWGFTVIVK